MYPISAGPTTGQTRDAYVTLGGGQAPNSEGGIYYNILHPEAQYVASVGLVFGCYQDANYRAKVFTYDPKTQVASAPVSLGGSGLSGDTHGAPVICIDANGYIRVFWGCHSSTIYYRKSTNPYDISAWDVQQSISGAFTYPVPYYYDGYWYLFHRTRGSYPLGWGWHRTSDFTTWSALTEVVCPVSASDATYAIVGQDASGGVHIFWCIWDGAIRKNLYYIYSTDLVNWKKADGTSCGGLPIPNANAELIVNSGTDYLDCTCGDVKFDSSNRPYCLFWMGDLWKTAHWNGASWVISTVSLESTSHFSPGCIAVESNRVLAHLRIYDSSLGTIKTYQSFDSGVSWQLDQVIQWGLGGGCMNTIKDGIEGCKVLFEGSDKSALDLCIL